MKQKIIKIGTFFFVLLILLRILYVNFFYPKTQLEYVNTDSFIYQGAEFEIMNVQVYNLEEGILAQIECMIFNETGYDIKINKNNIGLINGAYYLYCDSSDGTCIEIKDGESKEKKISFKINYNEWKNFRKADLIFMNFEKCIIKSNIFEEVLE